MAQERYNVKKKNVPLTSSASVKPPMSRRAEMEKKRRKEAAAKVMRKRRERKANFALVFILALVFVLIYYGTVIFRMNAVRDVSESVNTLDVFRYGEKKSAVTYKPSQIAFNKTEYLPLTFLGEFFSVTEFGDYSTHSFMIPSTGEWATFYIDTCNALINGQSVSISANSFVKDSVLYLPIDFYTDKMNCFDKLTYSSQTGHDVLTVHDTDVPEFLSKETSKPEKIDSALIPELKPAYPGSV